MCCNPEDLRDTAEWHGKGEKSRSKLVEKLQCMNQHFHKSVQHYSSTFRPTDNFAVVIINNMLIAVLKLLTNYFLFIIIYKI